MMYRLGFWIIFPMTLAFAALVIYDLLAMAGLMGEVNVKEEMTIALSVLTLIFAAACWFFLRHARTGSLQFGPVYRLSCKLDWQYGRHHIRYYLEGKRVVLPLEWKIETSKYVDSPFDFDLVNVTQSIAGQNAEMAFVLAVHVPNGESNHYTLST